mmetsp:Transcript_57613/g.158229  ORF Transcript_57613/g.158229 Transcript_57613/m.158229 type:complete len:202 (+) Transcript_57613:128-733(+)
MRTTVAKLTRRVGRLIHICPHFSRVLQHARVGVPVALAVIPAELFALVDRAPAEHQHARRVARACGRQQRAAADVGLVVVVVHVAREPAAIGVGGVDKLEGAARSLDADRVVRHAVGVARVVLGLAQQLALVVKQVSVRRDRRDRKEPQPLAIGRADGEMFPVPHDPAVVQLRREHAGLIILRRLDGGEERERDEASESCG